ncbi:MAG: hypothetical protein ABI836_03825 [Gemmatimonadota bacterium]
MPRSSAYWSANLYLDPESEPTRTAPLRDLPPLAAGRFRTLRDGLIALPEVTERIRFMGDQWRWAWEFGLPGRRLCWLHMMDTGIGGTFTISNEEEKPLLRIPRLPAVIFRAWRDGQRTGPVRWCWVEFGERRTVEAFLGFMKRKAALVRATPADTRIFGRSSKAG